MPGRMTPKRAAGVLRRRRAYLVEHATGKRASNLATRHEEQEIAALDVALDALDSTPVAPVAPPA